MLDISVDLLYNRIMEKQIDYQVIEAQNVYQLRARVIKALSEGYILAGGVATSMDSSNTIYYYQAVVLESA